MSLSLHEEQEIHHRHTADQREELADGFAPRRFFVEFGDEIGTGDVEQIPRGEGKKGIREGTQRSAGNKNEDRAEDGCARGEEV